MQTGGVLNISVGKDRTTTGLLLQNKYRTISVLKGRGMLVGRERVAKNKTVILFFSQEEKRENVCSYSTQKIKDSDL